MSDLFGSKDRESFNQSSNPLADRLRPKSFDEVFGQEHLTSPDGPLRIMCENQHLSSIILWGPPGVGKTTIARIIPTALKRTQFHETSAVYSGTADLKTIFKAAREASFKGDKFLLFVDEVHYFNKMQQDMFLPMIEDGTLSLLGATSQNPSFQLNPALLSRSSVFEVKRLTTSSLTEIIKRAEILVQKSLPLDELGKDALIEKSGGDARILINLLEQAFFLKQNTSVKELERKLSITMPKHDKSGDGHFAIVSAIHKSIRGSDPDAGLYWLARAMIAGEDPKYIFRRLLRISLEDIGLATTEAQRVVLDSWSTYERLGSPEGDISLVMAVVFLALSPKSNSTYVAEKESMRYAKKHQSEPPPKHMVNSPTSLMDEFGYGKGYEYDHNTEMGFSGQSYFPDEMKRQFFYHPVDRGQERELKKRLSYFSRLRDHLSKKFGD